MYDIVTYKQNEDIYFSQTSPLKSIYFNAPLHFEVLICHSYVAVFSGFSPAALYNGVDGHMIEYIYQLSILGVDTRASHSPSGQHSNGS